MFGNTANPKCKVCNKTAYQQESLSYDNQTYHKACFKCLQCGSRVALSKVAMIQGDLYCKNCFIRMFSEKGNYNVFLEKSTEAAEAAAANQSSPTAAPPSSGTSEVQANANYIMSKPRRGSVLSCLMSGCGKPRASGVNYCVDHQRIDVEAESLALIKAINEKSTKDVRKVLQEEGVQLAVQPNSKRQSPLELAFVNGSNSCGVVMIELLAERLASLQQQVRELQEQLEGVGGAEKGKPKGPRVRRNSAPRAIDAPSEEEKVGDLPSFNGTNSGATHHTTLSEAIPAHRPVEEAAAPAPEADSAPPQ